MFTRCSLFSDF